MDEFNREVQRRVSALPGGEDVSSGFAAPWRDDHLNGSFQFAARARDERTVRISAESLGNFLNKDRKSDIRIHVSLVGTYKRPCSDLPITGKKADISFLNQCSMSALAI